MKKIFVILSILFSLHTFAQTTNTVIGLIKDEKGNNVPYASVSLFRNNDTTSLRQTMANEDGIFRFSAITDGSYFVSVTSTGFVRKRSLNFTIEKNRVPFDTLQIKLSQASSLLTNVTVNARKPVIENRIDKTIVNVDAFLNNTGSTLLEVLGNSPNVDVDINGTINIKGKTGVLVLMDGKQNYLTGAALTNYLNSIPASEIDQIEIMTQPPARYDAAGNSGVINIKMKKNKQRGLTSNISASYMQGFYARTLNSLMINYKINKLNFFVSGDDNYIERYTHRKLSRYIRDSVQNIRYFQDENDIAKTPDHSLQIGIDYYPANDWALSILLGNKYSAQENNITDHSAFTDLNNQGKAISYLEGYNVIKNPWTNNSVGLNAKKAIGKNKEWSTDLNYENYRFSSGQRSANSSYDTAHQLISSPVNPYVQQAFLPVQVNIYSARTDLTVNIGKLKIETGLKSSFIDSKNNSSFYLLENDSMKLDNNLTNFYNYHENINAAYVNVHQSLLKWELQAGLRLEETANSGFQKISQQKFARSYWQVFPTLYLGYTMNENNNFSLSYGRRIDRPNYIDLNPFLYLIDQYTYRRGNPGLNPYFSTNVELNYNYKKNLHADLDYGITRGIIDNQLYQNDSTRVLLQSPTNLNSLATLALNINYTLSINDKISSILSYSIFNNHFKGQENNIAIDKSLTTNLINFTQQFRFNKNWSAELSILYRDKFLLNAVSTRGSRKVTGFAIGKTLMNNKLSLKLRVTDPFYIQQSYGSTFFGNIHTTTNFSEDSRRIGLTVSYRFQQGMKNSQRKLYSPEENSRVIQN